MAGEVVDMQELKYGELPEDDDDEEEEEEVHALDDRFWARDSDLITIHEEEEGEEEL